MKYVLMLLAGVLYFNYGMAEAPPRRNEPAQKTSKRILILGNSITYHAPSPKIGWNGSWGMAASSQDNDYVNLLKARLSKTFDSVYVEHKNIATSFERTFWMFDEVEFRGLQLKSWDIFILNIGENIDDNLAIKYRLDRCVEKLVRIIVGRSNPQVVVVGSFWPNKYVDCLLRDASLRSGWSYVMINDLYRDKARYSAMNKFDNKGVGMHPSDAGMKEICDRIYSAIARSSE